jgi:hypothetical protein
MMTLLALIASAWGQCTVISGARAHTPDGPQKGTTVVVTGDRIAAVGRRLDGLDLKLDGQSRVSKATYRGETCDFVTAGRGQLTAGFIDVGTQLGLVEVGLEPSSRHDNAGGDPVRASAQAADGYNPRSSLIPITRLGGLTSAVSSLSGGLVSGASAHVQLAGGSYAEAVRKPAVAFPVSFGGSTPGSLSALRELFADARAFQTNPRAFDTNQARELLEGASRLDLEALGPVVSGTLPIVVRANRAADLEAVVRLVEQTGVRAIVHGAAEGWLVADQLAKSEVAVVLDPLVYGPGSWDQIHGRADNPALLAEAGVTVILSTFDSHNARTLRQIAGNAVRGGMEHADALAAITGAPAAAYGLGTGRIEVGAAADLALWSGDPLEISSALEALWIGGKPVALESRQTKLRDAYRTLPGTPLPALKIDP